MQLGTLQFRLRVLLRGFGLAKLIEFPLQLLIELVDPRAKQAELVQGNRLASRQARQFAIGSFESGECSLAVALGVFERLCRLRALLPFALFSQRLKREQLLDCFRRGHAMPPLVTQRLKRRSRSSSSIGSGDVCWTNSDIRFCSLSATSNSGSAPD